MLPWVEAADHNERDDEEEDRGEDDHVEAGLRGAIQGLIEGDAAPGCFRQHLTIPLKIIHLIRINILHIFDIFLMSSYIEYCIPL